MNNAVLLPGQAAAPPGPADLRMMYVLHHGFRRDLARFVAAAEHTPDEDQPTWQALARRWDLFAELLHDHHQKEDDVLWPLLRDRATQAGDLDALRVLDEMEAEHSLIDPILAEARSALVDRAAGRTTDRDALVALLARAASDLGDHLSHEERDAIAILQHRLGGEEWADLERRKLRGGTRPGVLLLMLPWAMEDLPVKVAAPLLADAGLPVRLMLRAGRARFQRLESAAFRHVPAGVGA